MAISPTDPPPPAALTSPPPPANVRPMDTMKLLLGATIALLLGALAVSWQGMKNGVRNAPPDELASLQKQIKELRAEHEKRESGNQVQQMPAAAPPVPSDSEVEAMKAQLEEAKQELAANERAKRDKEVGEQEELLGDQRGLESKDSELRRARMISQSLLIGKVKDYVEDPAIGGFVTFDVLMPAQVQVNTVLAIRRKTGILGQLQVSDIQSDGAIANPLPGFGPVKPVVGDELILPPQY